MLDTTCELVMLRAPQQLDAQTAPALAIDLNTRIRDGCGIILDLSLTRSIQADCVSVIFEGLLLAKKHHVYFALRGVQPAVQLALKSAGVLQYFRRT